MGGHSAGDLASLTVIDELKRIPPPSSAAELLASCEARIVDANSRLRQITGDWPDRTIGTTIAVLLVYEGIFACVWAGDSRIYRVRRSGIEQLSVDHTEVQELLADGRLTAEEARSWPRRNVVTRAIGTVDDFELEITDGTLNDGDIFVICSDGLTAHVEDLEILTLAKNNSPQRASGEPWTTSPSSSSGSAPPSPTKRARPIAITGDRPGCQIPPMPSPFASR
jgi:protein phosphatase